MFRKEKEQNNNCERKEFYHYEHFDARKIKFKYFLKVNSLLFSIFANNSTKKLRNRANTHLLIYFYSSKRYEELKKKAIFAM